MPCYKANEYYVFFVNYYFIFHLCFTSCLMFEKKKKTSYCFEELIPKDWGYVFKRWMSTILMSNRTPLSYRDLMNALGWSRVDESIGRPSSPRLWIRSPPRFLLGLKLYAFMLSEVCPWNVCFWHIFKRRSFDSHSRRAQMSSKILI